ncbi:hypothetical protein B0T10DRAFT_490140 [Thelonectria olida]|uniref:Nuclear GTPase SLIP-GC n=1 Tax=Thelonectria olida TaxID=1576542 RepID=A0A9P8W556_9HYPO|nr:hypothetical protein B0T10DRAFT_490140 [Thelonectria olida]
MVKERRGGRAGSATDSTTSAANADLPIPSIEQDVSSPTGSSETSTSSRNIPAIRTPSTSASPQSPSPNASNSPVDQARRQAIASDGSVTRSMERNMQRMQLSPRGGIENLSDIADAVEGVARGSDSRSVSLAPDDAAGSRQGTPRRNARSRRSGSRTSFTRHDVRDEELPRDAFHDPSFQRALRDAKALMSTTHEVLGSASLHHDPDSTMQRLHKEAGELAAFTYPSTRTVGFVGDSGVGKSSLLNSLLDFRGLARTSNSGEACTCVVTEYHHHELNTFEIEVELFSMEDISEQLSTMLVSYRQFHLHGEDEWEESANQARDTFFSMFRGRLDDDDFLLEASPTEVLTRLESWAADARPSEISSRQSYDTLESCSARLMELSSEPRLKNSPAKWPFIRKVRVCLNAHILSKGLVLVDLPGLRDLNSARRSITERFLLECDEIFVICNIGRAVTDEGVQCVFRLAEGAQLSNVGIVCTRSDDIQADEAKRDWKGLRAKHIQGLQDLIAADRRERSEIAAQIAEYASDDEYSDDERDSMFALYRSQSTLKRRIRDREFQLHSYLVTTRNSVVTRDLQAQYTLPQSDESVNVFCVSNKSYWDFRDEDRDAARQILQLSGILEVRKHCISIVANSQRRIATRYMKDEIPALLAQIQLWVRSGAGSATVERKEAIRKNLKALKSRLEKDLSHPKSKLNQISRGLKKDFKEQIDENSYLGDWGEAAVNAGYGWAGFHHASYAAFCRNYGDYSTPAVGCRNWNEEAIEEMTKDLNQPWKDLRRLIDTRHGSVETLLDDLLEWSIEHLEDGLSEMPDITGPLINALTSQKEVMWSNMEQAHEEFKASLKKLRTDAMSGLQTSLIGQAMKPAYQDCNREHGRGSDARRKFIINTKLADEELFENLMASFRKDFRGLADGVQECTNAAARSFLKHANSTLDIILSDNVALESEQDPAFRRRVEEAIREGDEEIERIKSVISA